MTHHLSIPLFAALALASCSWSAQPGATGGASAPEPSRELHTEAAPPPDPGQEVAIFAGGCFWCMERPFEDVEGVISVLSGYTGGEVEGPSYEEVGSGRTGHQESVRVLFDPSRVSYQQLLEIFWHNVDPTQADGQFCDHGPQYRSGIFVTSPEQRRLAEESLARVRRAMSGRVATEIRDAGPFWIAEDSHQDFYRTHPVRYAEYRLRCGRDAQLRRIWGDLAGGH